MLNFEVSQVELVVKNPPANVAGIRDTRLIPVSGRSLGGGHGNPFQYTCLENPHGHWSLVGYSPQSCKEVHMTEAIEHAALF